MRPILPVSQGNQSLKPINLPAKEIVSEDSRVILLATMANATNVLAQGIEITGSIKFSNDMIIDGKVDGKIESEKGKVTIGENAQIKGDVKAGEVKMYGKVEGTIDSGRCELKPKSELKGDIKTKSLSMEEGAILSGQTQIG